MVDTFTTKLLLKKPDPTDTFNIGDASGVYDQIDAAIGYQVCTSSTRPVSPWTGLPIVETDTGNKYIYASSNWMCTEGTFTSSTRPAHPFLNCRIYQTDTNNFYRWNGTSWIPMTSPLGIIARIARTTNGAGTTNASSATAQGIIILSAALLTGRLYRVFTEEFSMFTATAPATQVSCQVEIHYTIDGSTPSGSNTVLNACNTGTMEGNGNADPVSVGGLYVPTSNITFKAFLGYWRTVGAGATIGSFGSATQPVVMAIEDMGVDPGTSGGTIL